MEIAKLALWISEEQALDKTKNLLPEVELDPLPTYTDFRIINANALTMDWKDCLQQDEFSYIVGNPEYRGSKKMDERQKREIKDVYSDSGLEPCGDVDYCAGWFVKTAKYMNKGCRAAFLSTSSICQGRQVSCVWEPLYRLGIHIDFAYKSFRWDNEAKGTSKVSCVVVGFSREEVKKLLFTQETLDSPESVVQASNINAYLLDAPDVFLPKRNEPVCKVPIMRSGNKPVDGGRYIFTSEEKDAFIDRDPVAENYMLPYIDGNHFVKGGNRWILWLGEVPASEFDLLPGCCQERIKMVKEYRERSGSRETRKLANRPTNFHVETIPSSQSLVVPETSSENRAYLPWGFVESGILCSNQLKIVEGASLYHFGVLQSRFHDAWARTVGGRHDNRLRYSIQLIYNNFVWPEPTVCQEKRIEMAAKNVLEMRAKCISSGLGLGEIYTKLASVDNLPSSDEESIQLMQLRYAHQELDAAVEEAYGVSFDGDIDKIVSHLFQLLKERHDCSLR